MRRRQFLKYSAIGATTILLGRGADQAQAARTELFLRVEETLVEMIDGERVFMLLFISADGEAAAAPTLRAVEGDTVTIHIENATLRTVGFEVPGAPGSAIRAIPPFESRVSRFVAPTGGSYFYLDPTNAPVNRNLGLRGAFISAPTDGMTAQGAPTPYSSAQHTEAIRALFGALGDDAPLPAPRRPLPGEPEQDRFPGKAWDPGDPKRDIVWLFDSVDPKFNALAERGQDIDPLRFVAEYEPRYFTLNGLSGFEAANDARTVPKGYVGEPTVIRVLNAGLPTFAPHIHGNHIFELTGSAPDGAVVLNDLIVERDTWTMKPLDTRDVLLPFEQPTDIPAAAWPPKQEPFPFFYPMHCHMELSQTAGGGNYPQGLITDWEILGPLQSTT